MSPFCIGFVEDPATVAAAVDAGLNAFFVSVDLHWPIYRHTVEGLRRLLRGRPSLRADIIVAAVSYVQNPGFTLAAFGELLAAAPELETLDVLVAGGCGVSRPFSRETLEEIRAILGANGRRPALGASFHDRTMALGVALEKDVDLVFLRYNPTHPGARHDTLPLMPELPERPLVYAFLTTFGSEAKGEVSETLAGGWRPRRQDYYRFALTRQQIDGLLFAPRRPEDIAPLLSAMEEGPLSCEEEESMLSAARRRRDPT